MDTFLVGGRKVLRGAEQLKLSSMWEEQWGEVWGPVARWIDYKDGVAENESKFRI